MPKKESRIMAFTAPDDVESVTELTYFLVAIPDDEKYIQAAMGSYTNLANRWLWGEETEHEDSEEIQQQWLNAIAETLEAYEMGFAATLLGHVDEIEALLQALQGIGSCCGDNLTYLPTTPVPNDDELTYEDNEPATWGDSETVDDLDDYQDILCGAAHSYVDLLVYQSNQMDGLVEGSLLTIAAIGTILGALATAGLSLLVEAALASAIFTAIMASWIVDLFSDAGTALESARSAIICAIFTGDEDDVKTVIQGAVSATAWTLFFQWLDYQSAINTMLYGEYDGSYLDVRRGEECDCGYENDVLYTFPSDAEDWNQDSGRSDWDAGGFIKSHPKAGVGDDPTYSKLGQVWLCDKAGISDQNVYADLITLDVAEAEAPGAFGVGKEVWIEVWYDDDTMDRTVITAEGTAISVTVNPAKQLNDNTGGDFLLWVGGDSNGQAHTSNFKFDNIRVAFHT